MSVYTQLTAQQVSQFIAQYDLGDYIEHKDIAAGIENSNFFVTTAQGEFVLTIFEQHNRQQVTNFLAIARHLSQSESLLVPCPITDQSGKDLHSLENKPAILCKKLSGSHPAKILPRHCFLIGQALAQFHLSGADFAGAPENDRSFDWWQATSQQLRVQLSQEQQELLTSELDFQQKHWADFSALPTGLIHGDLFHDNALFESEQNLGAVLDIYNACRGIFIYDLAIVLTDWCMASFKSLSQDGSYDYDVAIVVAAQQQLIVGYQTVRVLTDRELSALPQALRAAALRFWLSRLITEQQQKKITSSEVNFSSKDPRQYQAKLEYLRQFSFS